ncbi:uncharacterized protein LOC136031781 isoform X4 [Artemia franciscana]|uniref:uncharacterized protein LOC136031781 isoform X4 n=1 Tax=Artemia franciscana TaxID=6661 RepID=UPI0032D9F531
MPKKKVKGNEKNIRRNRKKDIEYGDKDDDIFDSWSSQQGAKLFKAKVCGSLRKIRKTGPVKEMLESFPKEIVKEESPYQSRRLLIRQVMNLELQKKEEELNSLSETDSWAAAEEKFSQIYEPIPFSIRMSELRKMTRDALLKEVKSDRLRTEFRQLSRSDILRRMESMKRDRGGESDYSVVSRDNRNENIYQSVSVTSSVSKKVTNLISPIYENANVPKRSNSFITRLKGNETRKSNKMNEDQMSSLTGSNSNYNSSKDIKDPPYISRSEIVRRASLMESEGKKPSIVKKPNIPPKIEKKVTVKNEPTYISRSSIVSNIQNEDKHLKDSECCDSCSECSCDSCDSYETVKDVKTSSLATSLRSTPEPVPLTEVKLRKLEFEKQKLLKMQSSKKGTWSRSELETIYEPVPATIFRTEMEIKELRKHLGNSEKLIEVIAKIETIKRKKLIRQLRAKLLESLEAKGDPLLMAKKQTELRDLLKKALDNATETVSNVSLGLIYVPMEENTEFSLSSVPSSVDPIESDTFGSIDSLIFEPKQGQQVAIDRVNKVIDNQFQYLDAHGVTGSESEKYSLTSQKSKNGSDQSDSESITSFNSVIDQGEKMLKEVEFARSEAVQNNESSYRLVEKGDNSELNPTANAKSSQIVVAEIHCTSQEGDIPNPGSHSAPNLQTINIENDSSFCSLKVEEMIRVSNVSTSSSKHDAFIGLGTDENEERQDNDSAATGTDCRESDTSWDFQKGKPYSEEDESSVSDYISLSEQYRENLKKYSVGNLRKKHSTSNSDPLGSVLNLLPTSSDLGTISTVKQSGLTTFREMSETLYSGNACKLLIHSTESVSSSKTITSSGTGNMSGTETPIDLKKGELHIYCSKNGETIYGAHNSSFLYGEYSRKTSLVDSKVETYVFRNGKSETLTEETFCDTLKRSSNATTPSDDSVVESNSVPPPPPCIPPVLEDVSANSCGGFPKRKAPMFGSGKRESVIQELKQKLKLKFQETDSISDCHHVPTHHEAEITKELANLEIASKVSSMRGELMHKLQTKPYSEEAKIPTSSCKASNNNLEKIQTKLEEISDSKTSNSPTQNRQSFYNLASSPSHRPSVLLKDTGVQDKTHKLQTEAKLEVNKVPSWVKPYKTDLEQQKNMTDGKIFNTATQTSESLYTSSCSAYDTHESSDTFDDVVIPAPLSGTYDVPQASIQMMQRFSPDGQSVPASWPTGYDMPGSSAFPNILIQDPQSLDITDYQLIAANPYQYLSPLELHHYRRLMRQQQEAALRTKIYPKGKRDRRKVDPNLSWSDIESIIFAEEEHNRMLASGILPPPQSTRMMAYKDDWILWDQLQRRKALALPSDKKRWEDEKTKRMLLWIHQNQSIQQDDQPIWWLAKQRASVKWLVSIAYDHKPPDDIRDPFYVNGDDQENLKPSVVHALANAELYCLALAHIYADPNYSQLNHWGVIQALARKGVYVAEPTDVALTETTLIQSSPLRMSAHMAVTEAIMTLYIKEVVTGDRIANAVRRLRDVSKSSIGGQSAHDVEEALVIWINQSCSALTQMIADTKVSETRVEFPAPSELTDLSDGIGICSLIACYCPDSFDWSQIAVNDPISVADSLHNLQLVQWFCQTALPYNVCHLTLEDLLYMHGSVKQNVIAFLAELFYLFEVRPAKCVKVPGLTVEKTHDGIRHGGGLRRQGSLKEKDKSTRMSLKEASTVTPGTKVATTQPIARRFQQSSISIELPTKSEDAKPQYRPNESSNQSEREKPEEFVVHRGRSVPTLQSVTRQKQQNLFPDNGSSGDCAQMAGVPTNREERKSGTAGRRSRRNSITEVESHLTIENFGGSQENLSMFSRNPDKEQAVHTGRRQIESEPPSRAPSTNSISGSNSKTSVTGDYDAKANNSASGMRNWSRSQECDQEYRAVPPSRMSERSDDIDHRDSKFYNETEHLERPQIPQSRSQLQDCEHGYRGVSNRVFERHDDIDHRGSKFYGETEHLERARRPQSRGDYQAREIETEFIERPRRPESRGQSQMRDSDFDDRRRSESRGPSVTRQFDYCDYRDDRLSRNENRNVLENRSRRSESRGRYPCDESVREYDYRNRSKHEDGHRNFENHRYYDEYDERVRSQSRFDDFGDRPRRPESRGIHIERKDEFYEEKSYESSRIKDEPREEPKTHPIVIVADPQIVSENPVQAVSKIAKATNFVELSKLRDQSGSQGLSIVYMCSDSDSPQRHDKRLSTENKRPKSLFVASQEEEREELDDSVRMDLVSARLKMEEKRRQIEDEKKRASALANKHRQDIGKAAFLQAVSRGRPDLGTPDSGGGELPADLEYRSGAISDGTDKVRSIGEMEERDLYWTQDSVRSQSYAQTPDFPPNFNGEQFYINQQMSRRTWGQPQPLPVGYGYSRPDQQHLVYNQPSPVRRAQWGQPLAVRPLMMQQFYASKDPAFYVPSPQVYDSPQQEFYQNSETPSDLPFRLHDNFVDRPQNEMNGSRDNRNSISNDSFRSAFTSTRKEESSESNFMPIKDGRRSEERESPILLRSRHASSQQELKKDRPPSVASQGSGGRASVGIHTQLPAPSVDDMEPQSISFIEMQTTDDADGDLPQRIQRLNLSSGSRTYRIPDSAKSPPRPSLSRTFFQAQQKELPSPIRTPEKDIEEEVVNEIKLAKLKEGVDADQGFVITFDDSPKPRRPKPQLGTRKPSSTPSSTTKSSTPESPITPQKSDSLSPKRSSLSALNRLKSEIKERSPSPMDSPSLNKEVQQITESIESPRIEKSTVATSGNSRLSGQSGLGFVIDAKDDSFDTGTLDDMERKKEILLMKSLKRKQEVEEAKRLKELEAQLKKDEEAQKEEEKIRKREEEKARRAAIFEQYKLKKAAEEAEKEGRTLKMPEPVMTKQNVRMRPKAGGNASSGKPRPKTIHVDKSDLGSRSRPGSTIRLAESSSSIKRSEGSKGSNSSLSGSSTARRGSNSSLHSDSLPRESGRRIEAHSGRKNAALEPIQRPLSYLKKKCGLSRGGSLKEKSSSGLSFGNKAARPGSRQGAPGSASRRFGSLMNLSGSSNNNENEYEGNTTSRNPVKRAPSPGMGNAMRTRSITSPSGPGSLPQGLVKQRSNLLIDDNASDAGSTASTEYLGPRLFKQPTAKSNRSIILNAVEYCIFPGAVNRQSKQQVLEEIAASDAKHFLVLFRDASSQFRALYEYFPESEEVIKLWGNGPKQVTENMFDKFFKYNSGGKCFTPVHTKTLTVTIDAFTIHSSLWSGKKTPLPNRKDMTLVI